MRKRWRNLLCYVVGLASGNGLPRHATFSPTGGRATSIFYQFIRFLGTAGPQPQLVERWMLPFIFSFHPFADPAKHPAGQPFLPFQLVRFLLPPPGSRGGRPVAVGPIGKQRPKIYFPASSPSLTSKHSNGPWKNVAEPSCRPAIFAHDDFHRNCPASSATKI